ncbi:MAG: hypothetical protein ABJN57_08890 [Hyphomicrobiales bacterium]
MYQKGKHWFFAKLDDFDTSNWSGRLRIKKNGAVRLSLLIGSNDFKTLHTLFEKRQILNGYLEHQGPVCLLQPFFMSFGINTYKIHAQCLLEGVHLTRADEACFTGFSLESEALHAILNPKVIKVHYETSANKLTPQKIDFLPNQHTAFATKNGTEVSVYSGASMSWRAYDVPKIKSGSLLEIKFSEPLNCNDAKNYVEKVHFFFCFLAGKQLEVGRHEFFTNKRKENNGGVEFITAKSIYKSSLRDCPLRMGNQKSFINLTETKVSLEQIFEQISADEDHALSYLMDMILQSERNKGELSDRFTELVGLLENFHKMNFGPKDGMSLFQRLEQLADDWKQDGFHAYPDLRKIKEFRNFKPHGRGVDFSHDDMQHIAHVLPFLSALTRYHILKKLGFDRKEIAQSFMTFARLYGRFIPK